VLDEFDDWFQLDEPTAIRLFDTDRSSAAFILKHLPASFWSKDKRVMWEKLGAVARAHGDEKLFFALYRKLMPVERWETEVLTLADAVVEQAAAQPCAREPPPRGLRHRAGRHGPEAVGAAWPGRDALRARQARGDDPAAGAGTRTQFGFIQLAERQGWWDLWSATARAATYPKLFNECIRKLMQNQSLGDDMRRERLTALAGVSREWNWPGLGLARIHAMDDDLAGMVYARYPDLIRGPFRANVTPTWWTGYPNLVRAAQVAHDEDLVDTLASRYATRISWKRLRNANEKPDAEDKTASELAALLSGDPGSRCSGVFPTRVQCPDTHPRLCHLQSAYALARQRPGALVVRALARSSIWQCRKLCRTWWKAPTSMS